MGRHGAARRELGSRLRESPRDTNEVISEVVSIGAAKRAAVYFHLQQMEQEGQVSIDRRSGTVALRTKPVLTLWCSNCGEKADLEPGLSMNARKRLLSVLLDVAGECKVFGLNWNFEVLGLCSGRCLQAARRNSRKAMVSKAFLHGLPRDHPHWEKAGIEWPPGEDMSPKANRRARAF